LPPCCDCCLYHVMSRYERQCTTVLTKNPFKMCAILIFDQFDKEFQSPKLPLNQLFQLTWLVAVHSCLRVIAMHCDLVFVIIYL